MIESLKQPPNSTNYHRSSANWWCYCEHRPWLWQRQLLPQSLVEILPCRPCKMCCWWDWRLHPLSVLQCLFELSGGSGQGAAWCCAELLSWKKRKKTLTVIKSCWEKGKALGHSTSAIFKMTSSWRDRYCLKQMRWTDASNMADKI